MTSGIQTPIAPEKPIGEKPSEGGGAPPPQDPGDGGGGGGGGGGDGEESSIPISTAKFAMMIFLCSLVMLFAGFVTAYIVLRFSTPSWPPPGAPPIPGFLWVTTAMIVASSVTMSVATSAARRARAGALRVALGATATLGVLFVLGQIHAWSILSAQGVPIQGTYGTVFYSLTGIHAAHVAGGVVLLLVVLARAFAGHYDEGRAEGVELAAMYWHFVDGVWLVLFSIL